MQQAKATPRTLSNKKVIGLKSPQITGPKINCKLNLTKVNGITSRNNSSIDFNPVNSNLAYITGSIVVIYDTKLKI